MPPPPLSSTTTLNIHILSPIFEGIKKRSWAAILHMTASSSSGRSRMKSSSPEALPLTLPFMVDVYKTIVSEFSVFGRWFVSVPASTQPNLLFFHSAGAIGNVSTKVESRTTPDEPSSTIRMKKEFRSECTSRIFRRRCSTGT